MADEYEQIRTQLTDQQIQILSAAAAGHPYMTSDDDMATFLRLGLFKRPRIDPGHESYGGFRESREGYGHPVISEFGREWVSWYKGRQ